MYEELLGKGKKDTVYTPDMVASTLIDECMPLKNPKRNFRLIDVSCGSGIFLVKAYKRIIQWWRYEQWLETGIMDKPDLVTMKQLLKQSIHGIDIQGDAVRLSVFSLALALLDDLDPKTIWTKLKFENLSKENVIEKDFFEFIKSNSLKTFDLVIGNPPFNPPHELSNGKYYTQLQEKYDYTCEIEIPDYNLALLFLVEALKLLKPDAILCLIQPSGPLLYQNEEAFKKAIFSKYNLLQVIDFTRLGDVLWGKANVATAALFLQNSLPDDKDVAHITVQRTPANLKKIFLELDHYDFHFISKESILSNPYVWKSNAIGGGRLVSLIERLAKLRTLRQFLDDREEDGWKAGEGFIENKKGKPYDYITGKHFLPAKSLTENGIVWDEMYPCDVRRFHRKTNKLIFTPPHILWRSNISERKLLLHFSNEYIVFRNKIVGIHAPISHEKELKTLFDHLSSNSDLLRFYILTTSSQLKVNRHSVPMTEDLMNIPFPSKLSDSKISSAESILINDVLNYQLSADREEALLKESDRQSLISYSSIFCKTLNSVYKNEQVKFVLVKTFDSGKYFGMHFEYSNKESEVVYEKDVDLEKYIKRFIPQRAAGESAHVQRILKYYSKDTIILVKPKNLRYWLKSIALRDADETLADYNKAGF